MAKLFFLLSGEHETLPVAELKAILEVEGRAYEVLGKLDQAIRLETDANCVEIVKSRAAFTRSCGYELFICEAEKRVIEEATRSANYGDVLGEKESFAVRVKHVKNYTAEIDGMALEVKLGEIIKNKNPRANVNLKRPDKTFIGILTENQFIFGLRLAEVKPKPFVERRPRKRPFFHPSAMQAKLARCMVNLAKPRAGDLLFDPFCGTGGMLVEAGLIGCRVVGLDVQRRMARGALKNLAYFGVKSEGVVVGDARSLPITAVNCVVTDPPYGTSATTMKRTTKQLVEELLAAVHDILDDGQRVCMAAPKTLNIGCIGSRYGYKHLESHFAYVHRSLTREIVVFEKV